MDPEIRRACLAEVTDLVASFEFDGAALAREMLTNLPD